MQETKKAAIAYYTALGNKDSVAVQKCLHPKIEFTDPQETVVGKEAVLAAAKRFMGMFRSLTIRTVFGSENQAMVVYDVEIPHMAKHLRAASLLSFQDGLISKIELIYDTHLLKGGAK